MVARRRVKRNKAAKPQQQKATPRKPRTRNPGPSSTMRGTSMSVSSNAYVDLAKWDSLLRDPCASNLAYPCYGGTDSGYLIRTTDILQPVVVGVGMVVGSVVPCNVYLSYTPASYTGGSANAAFIVSGNAPGGATPVMVNAAAGGIIGLPSGFIANSPVARFRPVAACLKWVPSGAYSSRQGVVGVGYSPSIPIATTSAYNPSDTLALAQDYAPNGSKHHEVRWLPAAADESWGPLLGGAGGGTLFCALSAVDGLASTATSATVQGYIEITTVWEWTPQATQRLTISPKAPSPFTTQYLLSTINDMGAYLFDGVRTTAAVAGQAAGMGLIRGFSNAAASYLTKGVRSSGHRAPAMITMT